ncbi:MAG: hypothetical protein ACT6RL_19885 [Neoaquamicrobium sediminum]|uniref:hypothetical protein n=1 Tax=Neoaquamicrobium sediminum TaxID=1849104 RepID=UPI0040372315
MGHSQFDDAIREPAAWNAEKKVGKRPFTRSKSGQFAFFFDRERRVWDRALFDLAIDSNLCGCDPVKISIREAVAGQRSISLGCCSAKDGSAG